MTFLPIVERELRVAARKRYTFLTRLVVAAGAILIGVILYLSSVIDPSLNFGHLVFWALAWLCIIHCLFAGRRSTADCISVEKREGTLGLLFLTDLKGYDVVAGKLVASSLNGFYGLLAVFPVLAVPLLTGGMTNGEFWRMVLVLLTTFLFSLAIGIFASAMSRDARNAMGANLLLMLGLAGVLPVCGAAATFQSGPPVPEVLYTCPFLPFYLSADAAYRAEGRHFWGSIAVIQVLTWLFIFLACRITPRSWQESAAKPRSPGVRWRDFWRAVSYGKAARLPAFRRRLLDENAFYWLAARARLKPMHVWMFLAIVPIWWLCGWFLAGSFWLDSSNPLVTAFILNIGLKCWIAGEAAQQLSEDRKNGALELILSTPTTVGDIVHGQFLALRRQFLKPLLVVIVVEFVLMFVSLTFYRPAGVVPTYFAGIAILVADMIALSWVAMSSALTAKNASRATLNAVVQVLLAPLTVFGLVGGAAALWSALGPGNWEPGWRFFVGWWFSLSLAADVFFTMAARYRLERSFRQFAAESYGPRPISILGAFFWRKSGDATHKTIRRWWKEPSRASRRWKWKRWAIGAVGVVLIIGWFHHEFHPRNVPPPVIVRLSQSQSNAPVRVFPGYQGFFFILPNGSLWRWGQPGGSYLTKARVPERVGSDFDWAEVSASANHCVGLKQDGTIWEWGDCLTGRSIIDPIRVDAGNDWIAIAAGAAHGAAIKRDGSLWTWGRNGQLQLGIGRRANQTNLVQVGTNLDWKAVQCTFAATFAVRDGALWGVGDVWSWIGTGMMQNRWVMNAPTQICNATNWTGFVPSKELWVRNQAGEFWQPLYASPGSNMVTALTCHRVVSSPGSDHPAFAVRMGPNPVAERYEVRSNGTLWATSCAPDFQAGTTPEKWHRVGSRSDWVSVWGDSAVVGLTSDGTLWLWGSDYGDEEVADFQSRLATFKGAISMRGGRASSSTFPPYQGKPRPLLKMVWTNDPSGLP
jgi:hypothetical protein